MNTPVDKAGSADATSNASNTRSLQARLKFFLWASWPLLPDAKYMDSWATRVGALAVVQVAAKQKYGPTPDGDVALPYATMVSLGTLALCFAAVVPLILWTASIINDKRNKKNITGKVAVPTVFFFVTLGLSGAWVQEWFDAILVSNGFVWFILGFLTLATMLFSISKLSERTRTVDTSTSSTPSR